MLILTMPSLTSTMETMKNSEKMLALLLLSYSSENQTVLPCLKIWLALTLYYQGLDQVLDQKVCQVLMPIFSTTIQEYTQPHSSME